MDTQAVKKELISREKVILERVEKLKDDKERKGGPLDPDLDEQASMIENDEVVDALDEVERHELESIRKALTLIEQGKYGECQDCGDKINQGRLKAIPYASLCINCAEED